MATEPSDLSLVDAQAVSLPRGARKDLEDALASNPSEDQAAKIRALVTKIG